MDILTALASRTSAGRLCDPGPNKREIDQILSAASHAPDHGRLSPWRFAVMQGDSREILANAMGALLMGKYPDASADMLANEKAKALRAPSIIAVAAHVTVGHKVPEIEQVVAVGAAIQNMLLASHALGFGTMWKTGAAAYDEQVKLALGFATSDKIIGFIYVGTRAAPGKARDYSLASLVRHL
jgi:nitroreductase